MHICYCCFRGGDASFYGTSSTGNRGIAESIESDIQGQGGYCDINNSLTSCEIGDLRIYVLSTYLVAIYDDAEEGDHEFCLSEADGCTICGTGFIAG